jgi:hypothetical protein
MTIAIVNNNFVLPGFDDDGIDGFTSSEEITSGMIEARVYVVGKNSVINAISGKDKSDKTDDADKLHLKDALEKANKKEKKNK